MKCWFIAVGLLIGINSPLYAQSTMRLVPPTTGIAGITCGSSVAFCVLSKRTNSLLLGGYAVCKEDCWVMIFNAPSVPKEGLTVSGTAPSNMVDCYPVKSGSATSLVYETYPTKDYSTGITIAISSTYCDKLTLSSVAFIRGMVQ